MVVIVVTRFGYGKRILDVIPQLFSPRVVVSRALWNHLHAYLKHCSNERNGSTSIACS
jgi:hypothetical protein